MSTRNIKDAKDLDTGELIYFKGHAQATFMSDGRTVEEAVSGMSGSSEKELIAIESTAVNVSDMLPNAIYYINTNVISVTITSFAVSDSFVDEYTLIGKYASGAQDATPMTITLPADVRWANGVIPKIIENEEFELSITRRGDAYKAVLTPFKIVE